MRVLKIFYILILGYLVLLQQTDATESSRYTIYRNVLEYIVVSFNSSFQPNNYWKVECYCSLYNKTWSPCKNISSNKFDSFEKLYFCFNITINEQQQVWSETKCFKKLDIPISLPPLENIKFSSLQTSDPYKKSLNLELVKSYSPALFIYRIRYRIRYWPEWKPTEVTNMMSHPSQTFILKDLMPFTNYTFIADFKSIGKQQFIPEWSPSFKKYFITETAAPYPVQTTNSSYYEWNCSNTTQERCITVFWQSLPLKFRNDIITGYCVQYIGESLSSNETDQCLDSHNLTVNSLYKHFRYLPKNQTLTFSIVAVSKSKRISQPTFIQVKNTAPVKPKAVYVMKIGEKMYNVSWLVEQPEEVVSITVLWCQEEILSSKMQCKDHVKWETISNESYVLVNSSLEELPIFSASVNTKDGESPLTRAECIFTPGKPTKPHKPQIIWAETKFILRWPTLQCSDWNGIPVAYVLMYAKGKTCKNGMKKEYPVTGIKAVESNVVINGLVADTEYSVCLQLKTMEDISLMSETVTETTKDTENSSLMYLGVFIGIFLFLLLITFILNHVKSCHKYSKSIDIKTLNTGSSSDDTECNYEKIKNYENQNVDGSKKLQFSLSEESGYFSYNSSMTEKLRFNESNGSHKSRLSGEIHSGYIQIDNSKEEFQNTLKNTVIINNNKLLPYKIEKTGYVSNEPGYVDIPGECFREGQESTTTSVDDNYVSNESGYVDRRGECFRGQESTTTSVDDNYVSNEPGYVDRRGECFRGQESTTTSVDDNYVSNEPGYVDGQGEYFREAPESTTTSVDDNYVSNEPGYVDRPGECFREAPESTTTSVDDNYVSNEPGYVDRPGECFREAPESTTTSVDDNYVSNEPGYVDGQGEYFTKSNSFPTHKNTNNKESISDYITSEPVMKDNVLEKLDEINNKNINSDENKLKLKTIGKKLESLKLKQMKI